MAADPKEILNRSRDPDFLQEFIASANTAVTAEMNQTRVASEVLLAKTIADAMRDHAKALQDSAKASERHARGLMFATWALVMATLALVLVEAVKSCR